MSCKEGKDSLLLKFNKGTLFSIYHLELKKELLRTPQYHVIHQKFFHWIWYLNLVWCVPYAKFWVQAKKHIKIHVFYNTGNFSQLIIIIMVFIFTDSDRICHQLPSVVVNCHQLSNSGPHHFQVNSRCLPGPLQLPTQSLSQIQEVWTWVDNIIALCHHPPPIATFKH